MLGGPRCSPASGLQGEVSDPGFSPRASPARVGKASERETAVTSATARLRVGLRGAATAAAVVRADVRRRPERGRRCPLLLRPSAVTSRLRQARRRGKWFRPASRPPPPSGARTGRSGSAMRGGDGQAGGAEDTVPGRGGRGIGPLGWIRQAAPPCRFGGRPRPGVVSAPHPAGTGVRVRDAWRPEPA